VRGVRVAALAAVGVSSPATLTAAMLPCIHLTFQQPLLRRRSSPTLTAWVVGRRAVLFLDAALVNVANAEFAVLRVMVGARDKVCAALRSMVTEGSNRSAKH
jgi:hypothetical protein